MNSKKTLIIIGIIAAIAIAAYFYFKNKKEKEEEDKPLPGGILMTKEKFDKSSLPLTGLPKSTYMEPSIKIAETVKTQPNKSVIAIKTAQGPLEKIHNKLVYNINGGMVNTGINNSMLNTHVVVTPKPPVPGTNVGKIVFA